MLKSEAARMSYKCLDVYAEPIRVLINEPVLPYHRPPLSKVYLLGRVRTQRSFAARSLRKKLPSSIFKGKRLVVGIDSINAAAEHMLCRRFLSKRIEVTPELLGCE